MEMMLKWYCAGTYRQTASWRILVVLIMNCEHEVLIIGGGPAGTSTAAILAEYGHKVLVIEREKFPRYHVGESLIPFTFGPLERLGLIPKMKQSHFMKKFSDDASIHLEKLGKNTMPAGSQSPNCTSTA